MDHRPPLVVLPMDKLLVHEVSACWDIIAKIKTLTVPVIVTMNAGDQLQRLTFFPNIISVSSGLRDNINFLRESESLQSVFLTFIKVSTFKSGPCGSIFLYNLPSDR
jgi:hypothetical protein